MNRGNVVIDVNDGDIYRGLVHKRRLSLIGSCHQKTIEVSYFSIKCLGLQQLAGNVI